MRNELVFAALAASALSHAVPKPQVEFDYACNDAAKKLVGQGFAAEDNWKGEEARAFFLQAVAADGKCLVAKLGAARNLSGPELKKVTEEVMPLVAAAPELDKQVIAAFEAGRQGQPARQLELFEKLRAASPHVYRGHVWVAGAALGLQQYDKAIEASLKAAALQPTAGAPQGLLGWTYTQQHKLPEAIAAYQKYVTLAPQEPNSHDSLADAYLAAGKFPEAIVEFEKAVGLPKPPFILALDGVATAKVLSGDLEGARAALTRYRDSARVPWQKPYASRFLAGTWMVEGKSDKALAALEQAIADGKPDVPVQSVYGWLFRSWYLVELGRWNEALAALTEADKVPTSTFNPGQLSYVGRARWQHALRAHAGLGNQAEVEKDFAALKKALEGHDDPDGKDQLAYGEGLLASAKKDRPAALAAFKRCSDQHWQCRVALVEADPAGTKEVRDQFLGIGRRDPLYLVLRAKLLKPAAEKAK